MKSIVISLIALMFNSSTQVDLHMVDRSLVNTIKEKHMPYVLNGRLYPVEDIEVPNISISDNLTEVEINEITSDIEVIIENNKIKEIKGFTILPDMLYREMHDH